MDNLPKIEDENKFSKAKLLAVTVLSLMVLSIPVGVYIVGQKTQTSSQAAVEQVNPTNSLILETTDELDAKSNELPVNLSLKADLDDVNLSIAKIKFDPNLVEVSHISTDSAKINKWLESSFDNSTGKIILIGGVSQPGLKTNPILNEKIPLATIYFKSKSQGQTSLSLDESSQLLRNSDNLDVLKFTSGLSLNLPSPSLQESSSSALVSVSLKPSPNLKEPTLEITTPQAASVYNYFSPIEISWKSQNLDKIADILLYLNGRLFGSIGSNLTNTGKYTWQPSQTLLIPYIQSDNSFQLEVVGLTKTGDQQLHSLSAPFNISSDKDKAIIASPSSSLADNLVFETKDTSTLLSNYLLEPLKETKFDLNSDGVINNLDLYLMRQILLKNNLIK